MNKDNLKIREKSWIARIAAYKLGAHSMAIVLGKTIHLHNTSKHSFLKNDAWVKHEQCHVNQFKQYGLLRFIYLYCRESMKNGYHNNKFEIEARNAEYSH